MRRWTDRKVTLGVLLYLCLSGSGNGQSGKPRESREEELFRTAGLATDNAGVLAYLKERARAADEVDRVDELVRQLGHARFPVRQQAKAQVIALGAAALPVLQQQFANKDPELAQNAKVCATKIEADVSEMNPFLSLAGVRLLTRRKAEGAVEALLRYLPLAQQAELETEIYYSLDELAVRAGKVHPALTAALADKVVARRAVSACIVGRVGDAEQKAAVRKLLSDADARVRLRAAQGLLAGKDASGITALVALVAEAPLPVAWQAEELLCWLAGNRAPASVINNGAAADRDRARRDWHNWCSTRPSLDWVALERSTQRPGLLALQEVLTGEVPQRGKMASRLVLVGGNGTIRASRPLPREVRNWMWSPGHSLVTWNWEAQRGGLVTAWNQHEEKCWETALGYSHPTSPPDLMVLENGHYLLCQDSQSYELNASGVIFRKHQTGNTVALRAFSQFGDWFVVTLRKTGESSVIRQVDPSTGQFVREDVRACRASNGLLSFKVLSDGRYLVAELELEPDRRMVVRRIDEAGNADRHISAWQLSGMTQLRNGNTLLTTSAPDWFDDPRLSWLSERDDANRVCWELRHNKAVTQVREVFAPLRLGFSRTVRTEYEFDRPAYWLKLLAGTDREERRRAAQHLRTLALNDSDLRSAYRFLLDKEFEVRVAILELLIASKGRAAEAVLETLLANLGAGDDEYDPAGGVLQHVGEIAIAPLIAIANDTKATSKRRGLAVCILGKWLNRPEVAVVLRRALADKDLNVQKKAIRTICRRKEAARGWLPEIVKFLKSDNQELAETVIVGLWAAGTAADVSLPALLEALEDVRLQGEILRNLEGLGGHYPEILRANPKVTPSLVKLLGPMQPPHIRAGSALVLSKMGVAARPGIRALIAALDDRRIVGTDPDYVVREIVADCIPTLGAHAVEAIPVLRTIALNPREGDKMRKLALRGLTSMGIAARTEAPVLLTLVKEANRDLVVATIECIEAIEPSLTKEMDLLRAKMYLGPARAEQP